MSYQKSYRRGGHTTNKNNVDSDAFQLDSKYRGGVVKLHELFPNWSEQDLQSVLAETGNDVETAVTRISEGHAEQWGNVSRKKEKKTPTIPQSASFGSSGSSPGGGRGVGRGTGGGTRGGRGGARGGRGGTPVGRTASYRDREARDGASPKVDGMNGTAAAAASTTEAWGSPPGGAWGESPSGGDWGADTVPPSTGGDAPEGESTGDWGATPAPTTHVNGTSKIAEKAPPPPKITPASTGGKLSWAQIARPVEKPKPAPVPEPQEEVPLVPEPVTAVPEPEIPPVQAPSPKAVWEEPTTAEAPIWDDEPVHVSTPEPTSQAHHQAVTADEEGWIKSTAADPISVPEQEETATKEKLKSPGETSSSTFSPLIEQSTTPSLTSASGAPSSVASPTPPPPKPATPRMANASKVASRFKPDQAVVMPSFGAAGTGTGSMGMQFGSLSISGDTPDGPSEPLFKENEVSPSASSLARPPSPPVSAPTEVATPAPQLPTVQSHTTSLPVHALLPQVQAQTHPSESIGQPLALSPPNGAPPGVPQQPPTLASLATGNFFQSQQQSSASLHSGGAPPPTSNQPSVSFSSSFSPLGQPQQQNASPPASSQVQPHQPTAQHPYSQHGLPTHVDTSPIHQQLQTQTQQSQNSGSYYGRQEYGTSPSNQSLLSQYQQQQQQQQPQQPAAQAVNQDQGYNAFSGLGQNHSGFNPSQDFGGYNDQRGFYEGAYGQQQTGFNSRDFLGQADLKQLPHQQQQSHQPTTSISPGPGQPGQHSQTSSSAQGPAGQGQQNYPPPHVPYYYNPYYQQPNPYYGAPNPGYGVGMQQPYMKYPLYTGPSAAGPGTPPSAGGKGHSQAVPHPSANAYAGHSGLYGGQHHQAAYDEGGYAPPQHQQQQHQGQAAASAVEYGKPPLYGLGSHSQSFMGQSNPTSVARHLQQPSAGTPDNAYKPYSGQTVPNVPGAKVADTAGRVQPLYGAASASAATAGASRFSAPGLPGVAAPQQGQAQGSYPQGTGSESNFYNQYQRPQYWQ